MLLLHTKNPTTMLLDSTSTSSSPKTPKKAKVSKVNEAAKSQTISGKKVKDIIVNKTLQVDGYRMFDMIIFEDIINTLLCPECKEKELHIYEDDFKTKRYGILFRCKMYNLQFLFGNYTSWAVADSGHKGMQTFDVNVRSVYAMRRCGVGHSGLEKCCGIMNLPPPVASKSYAALSNKISVAAQKVATCSMIEAATILKQTVGPDIGVSVDGTWQKRGFSSLNGVVAAISVNTGKVIDVEFFSKSCKSCSEHSTLKDTIKEEYEKWKLKHNCSLNYEGSSANMESVGALSILRGQSVTWFALHIVLWRR